MNMSIKKLFSTKKAVAVGASVALTLGLSGAAFAYFTSSGSGTGSATVGAAQANAWGVAPGSTTGGPLYPGAGTETVPFTITNNGTGAQAYSAVTASVASSSGNVTVSGVAQAGCLSAWFTAVAAAPSVALGTSIAPAGLATDNVTVTMQNFPTSQNPCEGLSPEINLSVS